MISNPAFTKRTSSAFENNIGVKFMVFIKTSLLIQWRMVWGLIGTFNNCTFLIGGETQAYELQVTGCRAKISENFALTLFMNRP